jgi:uncharacterized protein YcgI (DUF1989 family)
MNFSGEYNPYELVGEVPEAMEVDEWEPPTLEAALAPFPLETRVKMLKSLASFYNVLIKANKALEPEVPPEEPKENKHD